MGNYLPSTTAQCQEMLHELGLNKLEQLYKDVPQELMLTGGPGLPAGLPELTVREQMNALAAKNRVFPIMFRGAGAYRHYIPAIVDTIVNKEAFVTAYTPYQAEISQGILQSIFEYQTMICELTGMSAANASVYDGATAAAEAAAMCWDRKRSKTYVSGAAHPDVIATVQTYCWAAGKEMEIIPMKEGKTDLEALEKLLNDQTASVYIAQPNYFGLLEDTQSIGALVHAKGAKFIMGIHPIAAAILKTPGECQADIAVGEGQPLGIHLNFGGPYLGFMAATDAMLRKLPGRIVGETVDEQGRRAFVLTLQAREQHIRREKASSNICSNQALCAMTAAVYMAAMGAVGMKEAAHQSMSKAHYLAQALEQIGFRRKYRGEFFHEFVTTCPMDRKQLLNYLAEQGILGGLPIADGILWCVTEVNKKQDMDRMLRLIKEVQS